MAKMNALNAKPVRQPAPLKVTLLWSPQGVHGVAMTAVDVLKVMHGLASMRQAGAVAEPVWRWRSGSGGLVPRWPQTLSSLPTTPYRALPDLLLVPGWHAFNGPHLDQLVHQAADAVALIQRVHAAGACVLAVGNGVALLGLAGLLRDREAVAPWQFVQAVLRHSEGVRLQTDRPWTVSDRIWTCETPLWTTEMLLDALKTTRGAELAVAASHVLLHSPERQQVAAQIEQDVHARRVPRGGGAGTALAGGPCGRTLRPGPLGAGCGGQPTHAAAPLCQQPPAKPLALPAGSAHGPCPCAVGDHLSAGGPVGAGLRLHRRRHVSPPFFAHQWRVARHLPPAQPAAHQSSSLAGLTAWCPLAGVGGQRVGDGLGSRQGRYNAQRVIRV